MLGSIVIANYIILTIESKTIHRSKGQNMLFVMLSQDSAQEVHNKMPMLPSEETLLMTARIL